MSGETRPLLQLSSGSLPINRREDDSLLYSRHRAADSSYSVPRRSHSLHTNVVFAVAAVFLNVAFGLLNFTQGREVAVNAAFLVGAIFLTHAFVMLTHWSVAVAPRPMPPLVWLDVASTALKVPSALVLTLQPLTALWSGGPGLDWSNLAGIAALAFLNTVNAVTMPIMLWQRGKWLANLPSVAAWVFAFATYLLTFANAVVYFQPTLLEPVALQALQFSGAMGYEIGAWMFWLWAFRGEPLPM